MPEYVKQALEHESYSKIHPIGTLSSTLAYSLPNATMRVESLRLGLMSATQKEPIQSGTMSNDLERVLTTDKLEDTRSWELIPEIGGGLSGTREMTVVGNEISKAWIRIIGRILMAFTNHTSGLEGVTAPSLSEEERASVRRPHLLCHTADKISYYLWNGISLMRSAP
jgi:hypothetical protein